MIYWTVWEGKKVKVYPEITVKQHAIRGGWIPSYTRA